MTKGNAKEKIVVADFGSQYTQLIARKIRELNVYAEIIPYNELTVNFIARTAPKGIILSGGPKSVVNENSPSLDPAVFAQAAKKSIPILGICYGMHLLNKILGGEVRPSSNREYGYKTIEIKGRKGLFSGLGDKMDVWMSHGDVITSVAPGFRAMAYTEDHMASIANAKKQFYGVQFHPEVHHTKGGKRALENFLKICRCRRDWTVLVYLKEKINEIKAQIKGKKAIAAVSGGVDSTVAAYLVGRAIGNNLICVFINNGLLRKNEEKEVRKRLEGCFPNLVYVDASRGFLAGLSGIIDPEKKRKIIGNMFVELFEMEAKRYGADFLLQGTLYPDVIESVSVFGGPSSRIKSHHNVGGLPEKLNLKLIEPLRYLFKDEVRLLGKELGLPDKILYRHPFPGPGLAVRCPGEVTKGKLDILREADAIYAEELESSGLYDKIWQAYAAILPVKTTGVMGDERTYEYMICLRAVDSVDGMTANCSDIPHGILSRISNRIINEVRGVNRVVYDVSSKPPSTIELE